ncbi:MAG: ABC transporter permease [Betaproteobacteria bacterium]
MQAPSVSIARAVTGGLPALLRGRTLVAVVAIAFGVALGYAVETINGAAVGALETGLATLSGNADLEVQGPRAGFDERLYPQLAAVDGVAAASPVVEVDATIRGRDGTLTLAGVDVFRAASITPSLVGSGADRLDLLRPDAVFPSSSALRWLDAGIGDTIVVTSLPNPFTLRVAGRADGATRYAAMDIAAVQDAFALNGRLTRVDLRLVPGADARVVEQRIQALLPPGVAVARPQSRLDAATRLSRSYRVNLNVLALVALFTGSMLVFATQTLSIARRRPQFALLRTLGITRLRLVTLVVGEAAFVGAAASIIGIAAGHALAWVALGAFGPDLGAGFFRGQPLSIPFAPGPIVAFGLLGVASAVIGSALPAREAGRASPAAALRAGDADIAAPVAAAPGGLMIVAGILATLLPPVDELPLFGYAAIALIVVGGILVLPSVAAAALRRVAAPHAVPARLALAFMRASPGRVGATLAAMVSSVSLMVAMAIMVTSFRESLGDWLDVMLPADLYVRAAADGAFTKDERDRLSRIDGLARSEFARATTIRLDASLPRVTLLARDVDAERMATRLASVGDVRLPAAGAPPAAWISEPVADALKLRAGDALTLPLGGRNVGFSVAGLWRDYARPQGAIVVDRRSYAAQTGDDSVNEASLWLAAGARAADVSAAIVRTAGGAGRVLVATPRELRRLSLAAFDRTFAVTYALEVAAVVIGLAGLSAALVAQTLARSREFGMLRHVGMTRAQLGTMLAVEGATLAALGVAWGFVLGFGIGIILIEVVNRQSFHWGMQLHVPWLALAGLAAALVSLAALTARIGARQATSMAAVRAVRDDA